MKRIEKFIISILLACISFFTSISAPIVTAFADTTTSYDLSAIEDDLRDIDISKYPANPLGKHNVIRFMEYCYSDSPFLAEDYGLYLYVYNPTEKAIKTEAGANTANMAVAYNEGGAPSTNENVSLTLLDRTANNRFLKFKITDSARFLEMAKAYNSAFGLRRYDISGIQLMFEDNTTTDASDNAVAKTLRYTGYAAGCGEYSNAESTLVCNVSELETIPLEVGHTNYRFADKGLAYEYELRDDMNSVYFSVPQKYFDTYGGLQKITAEWYEYKTNPIFVTSDSGAYSAFWDYRNVDIGTNTNIDTFAWRVLWEEYLHYIGDTNASQVWGFNKDYNGSVEQLNDSGISSGWTLGSSNEHISRMDWIFYRENVTEASDYKVSRDEMTRYMEEYTDTFSSQEKIRGYAKNLFANSIDSDRLELLTDYKNGATSGHVIQTIDAGENKDIFQEKDQSWWDRLWHGSQTEKLNYSPIVIVDSADINLSKADFCSKYYVNVEDYDGENGIKAAFQSSIDNGEQFVLFRFAVTDYYASTARFDKAGDRTGLFQNFIDMSDQDGYVAQETVFLDFDVISLTFRKEGVDTVIGVVSDPFDIINGLDQPESLKVQEEWWEKIMALLLLIALLVVLQFIFPPIRIILGFIFEGIGLILKWLFDVLMFPFRLIGKLFENDKRK